MRSVPFTVAAAVGALLLLSACSGDSGSGSGSDDGSSSTTSDSSGSDAGKDSAAKESPLNAYTKSIPRLTADDAAESHKEVENLIAACMKEAGFEYTPEDPISMPAEYDEAMELDPVERAEKYGYGGAEQELLDAGAFVSPNGDYIAAMSASEAAAYSLALYGEEQASDEFDWTKGGCFAKAQHEVSGNSNAAYEDPAYEDLYEAQRLMFEKVPDDPRLAEINAQWSACMSEAGFDFARVNEAYDSITEARAALSETADTVDETVQADFKSREMATAIADAKCQKKVGYPEKLLEVQFALEQEFIDTHKAELDAWIEQYATDK